MKKLIFILFAFFIQNVIAQNKGMLVHYQRNCNDCLSLAGESFQPKKFTIYVPDSVYSNGQISIKKIIQSDFRVNRANFMFDSLGISLSTFYIKGKKNIQAYDAWVQQKLKAQPELGTNIYLFIETNELIVYAENRKKRKIAVSTGVKKNG